MVQDQPKVYDLLVVGAGPVGLATALAAHKRGCRNIMVVDQAREFKPTGDFININPNGVRAMRYISPEIADWLCSQNSTSEGAGSMFKFANAEGTVLTSSQPKPIPDEPNVGTTWFKIQSRLREALPEDITVRINSQLLGLFDEDDGTVRADFITNRIRSNPFAHWNRDAAAEQARTVANGSSTANGDSSGEPTTVTMHAHLVVAADGINSFTRGELYRRVHGDGAEANGRANYSGFTSFKSTGFAPSELAEEAKQVQDLYIGGTRGMCLVGSQTDYAQRADAPNLMLVRIDGESAEKLGWEWKFITHSAVPEHLTTISQRALGYPGLVDAVVEQLRLGGFPDFVQRLARGMLSTEGRDEREIICRPLYIVPMTTPAPYERVSTATSPQENLPSVIGHGRIILVGDSLHGMPPFISQGTSMGWEDVVELVDLLANACGWAEGRHDVPDDAELELLRTKYFDARVPRVALAQEETLRRRWAIDMNEFSKKQYEISDFQPVAKGWSLPE